MTDLLTMEPQKMSNDEMHKILKVITKDQYESIKSAFEAFDKNGDGIMSVAEIGTVMRSLGENPTESEMQEILNKNDVDGNGFIDFDEFMAMMMKRSNADDPESVVRDGFRAFDMDGNGVVSAAELRHVMANIGADLTDAQIDDLIDEADTDGDGQIEYDEFRRLMGMEGTYVPRVRQNSSP